MKDEATIQMLTTILYRIEKKFNLPSGSTIEIAQEVANETSDLLDKIENKV